MKKRKPRKPRAPREVKLKTSVTVGLYYRKFIKEQIETGKYSSISDVMTAGLRLLEKEAIMLNKRKNRKT